MDRDFEGNDSFMMSNSLAGRLDEKTLLGNDETDESLTVTISPHGGVSLVKNLSSIERDQNVWKISYRATPGEVIQSSTFSKVDFSIHGSEGSKFSIVEKNRKIVSLGAELDYPGSYICKLVLAIE